MGKQEKKSKERKKERKASHHCSSHEVLYVCPPPPGVVEDVGGGGREGLCVCGGVLFAVILTMPYMPYVVVPSSWARSCCQAECPVS